jgi:hypothetical protein
MEFRPSKNIRQGDKRDHPKEISDQHPEHNEESNRRQHAGRTCSLGE